MFWLLILLRGLKSVIHSVCIFYILTSRGLIHREKRPKERWAALWGVYAAVVFMVAFLFGSHADTAAQPVFLIITGALEVLFLFFVFKKRSFKYVFFVSTLYKVFTFILMQSVIYTIYYKIDPNDIRVQAIQVLLELAAGGAVLVLLRQIRGKRLFKSLNNQAFFISWKNYIFIIIALLSAAILGNVIFNSDLSEIKTVEILRGITIIVLDILLTFIIILLIVQSTLSHYKEYYFRRLSQTLSKQIDIQIQHYKAQKEHEEALAAFRHDYKNLVLCLRALLEENETGQALEYLDQMNLRAAPQKPVVDSGNYIADALIAEKSKKALEQSAEIRFEGLIPSSGIENLDVCVILANALDNAIEACAQINGGKVITIVSAIRKNLWLLSISNPTGQPVIIKDNQIKTTKGDTVSHGFGLYNIEDAVKRGNGQMTLECKDNIFTLNVTVQLEKQWDENASEAEEIGVQL